jgi:hypothetical protein
MDNPLDSLEERNVPEVYTNSMKNKWRVSFTRKMESFGAIEEFSAEQMDNLSA